MRKIFHALMLWGSRQLKSAAADDHPEAEEKTIPLLSVAFGMETYAKAEELAGIRQALTLL